MSERQPKRIGKLGRVALAASVLGGGASMIPADVEVNIDSRDAEGATCTPYAIKHLDKSSTSYSIRGKRFVIVGDITNKAKGLSPDKDPLSVQVNFWNLPETATQSGILSDKGDSHVEIFNSCATTTQVRAEIMRLQLINVPNGNAEASIDFHEITTTAAEPHANPEPACDSTPIGKPLPTTSENGTITIQNVKRAVITGDIKVQDAIRDNNEKSGMTTIIDLSSKTDLPGVNNPYGAWIQYEPDCASTKDFEATIGHTQRTQTELYPAGQQTFIIKNP
jgi:hypothetical protein